MMDGESDTLRIAVPVLYGIQSCSWLLSLVCLVCLRVTSDDDLTHGFEIQDPKRESAAHSLEGTQYSREGQRRSKRSSRSFMGFRQSVVAPLEAHSNGAGTSEQQQPQKYAHTSRHAEQSYGAFGIQEPEKSWVTGERRSSQDSNIIIFPKDKRISQVVLTFRDDFKDSDAALASLTKPVPAATNGGVLEARTVFITNHHYGLGDMLFDQPGESLSDMIFKAVQPLSLNSTPKETFKASRVKETTTRASHDSEQTDTDTRAGSPTSTPKSPTLSAATTLDGFGVHQQDGEQEGTMVELALTPASDSGVNLSRELEDEPYRQSSQISRQQGSSSTAMSSKHPDYVPKVPERRSSVNHASQPIHYPPYPGDENEVEQYEHHNQFVSPAMQPNSSDAHPCSGDYSSSRNTTSSDSSSLVQSTTQPTPPPRPKPSLASLPLQYWRNRNNSNNNQSEESSSSSPTNGSSVSFSLVSTFSKKKRQLPTLPIVDSPPQPPPLMIPTIVLHPDEEDGEPARVLSDKDIEYLSTMPPAPLRPLIPSWEEDEEEYYDQDINEGYDYDDYHQGYEQGYDEEGGEEGYDEIMDGDEGDMDTGMDVDGEGVKEVSCKGVVGRLEQPGVNPEVEYDPYALDVPIHLEIDLQGLEQGDVSGYGYI
ncbi:hypothetical protein BGZ95_010097 [Linnemannia exigua]|uniref:Uncharacterized protein n=1 Tax=Linnemannia exigua TaxID=604196 RepID=A0AAD4HAD8_9FUNG|nr:hypothetical protein BGZ95_010097 [Linnemannia exigua]